MCTPNTSVRQHALPSWDSWKHRRRETREHSRFTRLTVTLSSRFTFYCPSLQYHQIPTLTLTATLNVNHKILLCRSITRPTQQKCSPAIDLAVDMAAEERVVGEVAMVAVVVDLLLLIVAMRVAMRLD